MLAHILTAACSTVTQLWEGMRPGHIRGERATCLQEQHQVADKTSHAQFWRNTHPDLSSTHSLKLDARYLLPITNMRETQHTATNAHNDAVVVRNIECSSHLQAVIYGPPCESVTQLLGANAVATQNVSRIMLKT